MIQYEMKILDAGVFAKENVDADPSILLDIMREKYNKANDTHAVKIVDLFGEHRFQTTKVSVECEEGGVNISMIHGQFDPDDYLALMMMA